MSSTRAVVRLVAGAPSQSLVPTRSLVGTPTSDANPAYWSAGTCESHSGADAASRHDAASSRTSRPPVGSTMGRWMVQPSRRTSASIGATTCRSDATSPNRFIEVNRSSTTRAPAWSRTTAARSSTRPIVVMTRSSESSSVATGSDADQGVRTTMSPSQPPARAAETSPARPTANVSTPRSRASEARRASPNPYPLPFATGTMPGVDATTDARWSRQACVRRCSWTLTSCAGSCRGRRPRRGPC